MESPVIYIISGKNPLDARSGYAAYAYNLAKIITQLGFKVEIFMFGKSSKVIQSEIGTIHIIGSKLFSFLKGTEMAGLALLAPKLSLSLAQRLKNEKKTVIFWGIGPWSLSLALIKLFWNKKIFFLADYFTSIKHEFSGTVSAIEVKDYGILLKLQTLFAYLTIIPILSFLERFLLFKSDLIITHYFSTEQILKSQFGINSKKFKKLSYYTNSIKAAPTHKLNIKNPLIISVCRHDGRKGINYLLHAFSILNKKKFKYEAFIIGTGILRKAHIKLAKKLGLKNVYQPGFVSNLEPYLKKATVFVLPSLEEGSSALSILEAMKEGLPIVSTNIDGIIEDLENNKSALLVPPKNPQALANAIEQLLINPKLGKVLGKRAKTIYQKRYNLNKVKKDINKLIQGFF